MSHGEGKQKFTLSIVLNNKMIIRELRLEQSWHEYGKLLSYSLLFVVVEEHPNHLVSISQANKQVYTE
jgi:hypothetical protein